MSTAPNAPSTSRQEDKRVRQEDDLQGRTPHPGQRMDKEVKDSFPASDPPSSTQPGSGITGPEVARKH